MRLLRRLAAPRRGIAAIEFALVAPLTLLMIVGVFDISKAVIIWQQVCNTAHAIPVSASTLSEQPDKSTSLTVAQVQQSLSTIFGEIPWIRNGIETGQTSATLSAVTFVPQGQCMPSPTQICTYAANVAWSVAYQGGPNALPQFQTSVTRPCGAPLKQIGPTDPIPPGQTNLTILRTLLISQPAPILVADVHYRYTPRFFSFLTGPVDFYETGYWPVRSVNPKDKPEAQYTRYTGTTCPGFP